MWNVAHPAGFRIRPWFKDRSLRLALFCLAACSANVAQAQTAEFTYQGRTSLRGPQSSPANGDAGRIEVIAEERCAWQSVSTAGWITFAVKQKGN